MIKTKLTVLALAAAVLTTTLLVAGSASATIPKNRYPGHGPVVTGSSILQKIEANGGHPFKCLACTTIGTNPPHQGGGNSGTHGGGVISCHPGTGCTLTGGDRDGDRDRDHRRWYHDRPEIVIEGAPGEVVVPATPVQAVPVRTAAPEVAGEPCNCLTKQELPDGSVLFQDICTKQSAIAPPQTVGAR
jgi:hypothetical protein